MAEVLLFHHAQGLTTGMRAFADRLRAGGHVRPPARPLRGPGLRRPRRGRRPTPGRSASTCCSSAAWPRRRRACPRARARRLLARGAAGAVARADPSRRARGPAVRRVLPAVGVRRRLAGGRPRAGARHGRRTRGSPRRAVTSTPPARSWRRPPTRRSCSSTPATSTCSPTAACPGTTRRRRPLLVERVLAFLARVDRRGLPRPGADGRSLGAWSCWRSSGCPLVLLLAACWWEARSGRRCVGVAPARHGRPTPAGAARTGRPELGVTPVARRAHGMEPGVEAAADGLSPARAPAGPRAAPTSAPARGTPPARPAAPRRRGTPPASGSRTGTSGHPAPGPGRSGPGRVRSLPRAAE